MKNQAAIVIICLAGVLSGCNRQDATNLARDTGRLAKDTSTAVSGAALAGKVNTVLSMRKGVHMAGLHVEADAAGNVKVSGHVPDNAEIRRIHDTVIGVTGVNDVSVRGLKVER